MGLLFYIYKYTSFFSLRLLSPKHICKNSLFWELIHIFYSFVLIFIFIKGIMLLTTSFLIGMEQMLHFRYIYGKNQIPGKTRYMVLRIPNYIKITYKKWKCKEKNGRYKKARYPANPDNPVHPLLFKPCDGLRADDDVWRSTEPQPSSSRRRQRPTRVAGKKKVVTLWLSDRLKLWLNRFEYAFLS